MAKREENHANEPYYNYSIIVQELVAKADEYIAANEDTDRHFVYGKVEYARWMKSFIQKRYLELEAERKEVSG